MTAWKPKTRVALGEPLDAFVARQVAAGRHASAAELVRAAVRQLQATARRERALRDALELGARSGDAGTFDLELVGVEGRRLAAAAPGRA